MFECGPMVFFIICAICNILAGIQFNYKSTSNNTLYKIINFISQLICWILSTYILHLLCLSGNTQIAWVLVLLPFIILSYQSLVYLKYVSNN